MRRMRKCINGHYIFLGSHLYCPKCGVPLFQESKPSTSFVDEPEQPETDALSGDILLYCESIHLLPSGHVGMDTEYLHEKRIVTHKRWGIDSCGNQVDSTVEILEVPTHITTEQELREYVAEHDPYWIR